MCGHEVSKSILYKHSHVAYETVMKSRIQWCKNFVLRVCLGVTRGKKVGCGVLFVLSILRLFELEP